MQEQLGTSRLRLIASVPEWSASRIYNQVNYTNGSTTKTEEDSTSQSQYGVRSLSKTVPNNDNTDLETLATRDLALLKDDKLVLKQVTLGPLNRFESLFGVTVTDRGSPRSDMEHNVGVVVHSGAPRCRHR